MDYYIYKGTIVEHNSDTEGENNRFADNVGNTYDDYYNGKYVALNEAQLLFYKENPSASIKEIWDMQLDAPYTPSLEIVRDAKIREIKVYDQSSAVNNFILYGENCWLDKQTRVGITNLIDYQLAAGLSVTNLWLNGREYIFTIAQARDMLGALELYAIGCYNVTQRHIAAINNLTELDDVENYDYTVGYPTQLNFLK